MPALSWLKVAGDFPDGDTTIRFACAAHSRNLYTVMATWPMCEPAQAVAFEEEAESNFGRNATTALKISSHSLEKDWVRDFILDRNDAAADLQNLVKPLSNENTIQFSCVSTFWGLYSSVMGCTLKATFMMIPCTSIGSDNLGMVIRREHRVQVSNSSPGGENWGDDLTEKSSISGSLDHAVGR